MAIRSSSSSLLDRGLEVLRPALLVFFLHHKKIALVGVSRGRLRRSASQNRRRVDVMNVEERTSNAEVVKPKKWPRSPKGG
jgi:hypothetical protein